MSSQRGNLKKHGQKHKNAKAFKNNMHDTSNKTKIINSIQVTQCCARCTETIEWKIRYKKYKLLTVPKKCTKCQEKAVKKAYCIVCEPCAKANQLCMKCGAAKGIVQVPHLTEAEENQKMAQLEQELKFLPERKRRTFRRLQESGRLGDAPVDEPEPEGATGHDGNSEEDENSSNEEDVSDDGQEDISDHGEEHVRDTKSSEDQTEDVSSVEGQEMGIHLAALTMGQDQMNDKTNFDKISSVQEHRTAGDVTS